MRKSLLALLLSFAMLVSLLSGCGGKSESASAPADSAPAETSEAAGSADSRRGNLLLDLGRDAGR